MAQDATVVAVLGMQIQDQVPERTFRGLAKSDLHVLPLGGECLEEEIAHVLLIARVLETHDVVGVAGDALGEFARREGVLTQEEDRNVLMMRMFGEEIEYPFVVASFLHEIVQDQHTSFLFGKPHGQEFRIGNPFVKMDALLLHALEPVLPGSVTVIDAFGRALEQIGMIEQ